MRGAEAKSNVYTTIDIASLAKIFYLVDWSCTHTHTVDGKINK